MAFTVIDKYTAKALEKGLSTAIKAADCRFQSYGPDNKKSTSDDDLVGPVAYTVLSDPKNEDPDIAKIGTVTKIFFKCSGADSEAKFETTLNVSDAVAAAKDWVESSSMTLAALTAKYPA